MVPGLLATSALPLALIHRVADKTCSRKLAPDLVHLGRWWRLGRTAAKPHPDPVRKGSEADQHHEQTYDYSEHGDGPQDPIYNYADHQRQDPLGTPARPYPLHKQHPSEVADDDLG